VLGCLWLDRRPSKFLYRNELSWPLAGQCCSSTWVSVALRARRAQSLMAMHGQLQKEMVSENGRQWARLPAYWGLRPAAGGEGVAAWGLLVPGGWTSGRAEMQTKWAHRWAASVFVMSSVRRLRGSGPPGSCRGVAIWGLPARLAGRLLDAQASGGSRLVERGATSRGHPLDWLVPGGNSASGQLQGSGQLGPPCTTGREFTRRP
jgi:hypothetical protein